MLYGFGDVESPRQDTVEILEDMVVEYISDTIIRAQSVSQVVTPASSYGGTTTSLSKLRVEDIIYVLRNDSKKLARVEELLFMNKVVEKARKAFNFRADEATPAAVAAEAAFNETDTASESVNTDF